MDQPIGADCLDCTHIWQAISKEPEAVETITNRSQISVQLSQAVLKIIE